MSASDRSAPMTTSDCKDAHVSECGNIKKRGDGAVEDREAQKRAQKAATRSGDSIGKQKVFEGTTIKGGGRAW